MAISIATDPPYNPDPNTTSHTGAKRWAMNRSSTVSTNSSQSKHSKRTDSMEQNPDFEGDVDTNNEIPTVETLQKIDGSVVLGEDRNSVTFRSLYTGPNIARRVMVIFIRHFFCGNCQEYIRSVTASISPSTLLQLPIPTTIVIIGHGSPSLIPMYRETTGCPFPIYADPSKKLYDELGMFRTLNMGHRPEYQRKELFSIMAASVVQSLKNIKGGKLFQGGDYHQVGGEFMFEPIEIDTPVGGEYDERKQLGGAVNQVGMGGEEKQITWCHRMRNTRDHAEIPELMEVLGLDGEGASGPHTGRWSKALGERKGTGLSNMSARTMSGKLEGGPKAHN